MATKAELERQARERMWPKAPQISYGAQGSTRSAAFNPLEREVRKQQQDVCTKVKAVGGKA